VQLATYRIALHYWQRWQALPDLQGRLRGVF